MPNLPQTTTDRLQLLERDGDDGQRSRGLRDRVADWVWPRPVFKALTAEGGTGNGKYVNYPRTGCVLPVCFVDPVIDEDTSIVTSWKKRTPVPRQTVLAPCWFPPNVLLDIAWDGKRYQVTRWPTLIHGRVIVLASAAVWHTESDSYGTAPCGGHILNSGTMEIYRQYVPSTNPGYDRLQKYADGNAVTMTFFNTSNTSVAIGKFISVAIDVDHRWCVVVEPCGGACTDGI